MFWTKAGLMTSRSNLPDAYPLQWPSGWDRTPPGKRRNSDYTVGESRARDDLFKAIRLLGGSVAIVSSNMRVRLDGIPYAHQPNIPDDPGVAVYWVRQGRQEVMACDRWRRPWENMRAIYQAIEGLRAMERAGATQIMERAFQAFQLPATAGATKRPWRTVLGFGEHLTVGSLTVKARFKELAVKLHPDVGGDVERFQELERAYREALEELG